MDLQPVTPLARKNRRLLAVLMVLAVPLLGQKSTESDVKAAYLLNFGKFLSVTPEVASRRASFDICVLGKDEVAQSLERLTANEANNGLPVRSIVVPNAVAARSCAILFISASEIDRLEADLQDLADAPVLTVSDLPRFLHRGGMIQFEPQANHIRFSVSLDPVNRVGLVLSSQLLKVALKVEGVPRQEAK